MADTAAYHFFDDNASVGTSSMGSDDVRLLSGTPFRHKRPRNMQPGGSNSRGNGSGGGSNNGRTLLSTAGRSAMMGRLESGGLGMGGGGTGGGSGSRMHAKLLVGGVGGEGRGADDAAKGGARGARGARGAKGRGGSELRPASFAMRPPGGQHQPETHRRPETPPPAHVTNQRNAVCCVGDVCGNPESGSSGCYFKFRGYGCVVTSLLQVPSPARARQSLANFYGAKGKPARSLELKPELLFEPFPEYNLVICAVDAAPLDRSDEELDRVAPLRPCTRAQ